MVRSRKGAERGTTKKPGTKRNPFAELIEGIDSLKARRRGKIAPPACDPHAVKFRGKEAAIVIAPEQFRQLLPKHAGHAQLLGFLQGTGLGKLEVEREFDPGRKIDL